MQQLEAPSASHDSVVRRYEGLFIDGEWREALSGKTIESIDPATGAVWAHVPEAGAEDIDAAVKSARRAFESTSWQRTSGRERGRLLRRLADLIDENADELALLESRDNGKAIRETKGRELPGIPEWMRYFGGYADKLHGETIPIDSLLQCFTVREPVGVIGGILPWNAPLAGVTWKLAPAIAGGNTIVLKPAEFTSVTALEIARLVEEAGFPPGVVNVVPGYGKPAGEAMVKHPDVDKIAFTGEAQTAREITVNSTGNLKRLSFELGGKSANILFADCEYDTAVPGTAEAAFIAAGQSCSLGSRIFVEKPIYDRVVSDLVATASAIGVGDPLDETTQMGAQTNLEQLEKIESYVQAARDAGAEILCGGERAVVPGFEGGYFYRPTIIAAVNPEMTVFQEEIFGPVVTIMPFETEEEAIELANGTCYGLGAGFWTTDLGRTHRVARALRAGSVWVNTFRFAHWQLPFGGVKLSGYGRENGLEVMSMYTETKTVAIDHRSDRPQWFG